MTENDGKNPPVTRAGAMGGIQGTLGLDPVEVADLDAEFGEYASLEEDEDRETPPAPTVEAMRDPELLSPKERRLVAMRLEARVEAVLFATSKPLKEQEILDLIGDPTVKLADVEATLATLLQFYEERQGGFRLHYIKRLGYQFQSSDDAAAMMERMFASRPRPISRAALETLAIIAYRQPVTRAEVEFIRGVDAGSIFKTLLERDLIKCTGRKEVIGRPMMFGTTDEFLKVFNLSSVKDLPPLEAFQPSRDVLKGAKERLEEGLDSLVDVEQYIAEQVAGTEVVPADETGEEIGRAHV